MHTDMTIKYGCKVSVMGDSVSTYEGYIPTGYFGFYGSSKLKKYGLSDVHDTWWMRVIDALGGELCVNNSYSGSTVAGAYFPAASCNERCSSLGRRLLMADGSKVCDDPDLILIYIGTNDSGYKVKIGYDTPDDPESFYGSYRTMIRKIKTNYPCAVVACATLPLPKLEDRTVGYAVTRQDPDYNNAIRKVVTEEKCLLCDLDSMMIRYESPDLAHPNRNGHATLADLWLRFLLPLMH